MAFYPVPQPFRPAPRPAAVTLAIVYLPPAPPPPVELPPLTMAPLMPTGWARA